MDICDRVLINEHLFTNREQDFASMVGHRLANHKEKAYISVGQINWLRDLEGRLKERGL